MNIKTLYEYHSLDLPLRPDTLLEENDSIYFIEIKSKATIETGKLVDLPIQYSMEIHLFRQ